MPERRALTAADRGRTQLPVRQRGLQGVQSAAQAQPPATSAVWNEVAYPETFSA
jgi:hypothetical protein